MKKVWILLLLVLLVSAALVLPAAAAKGGKPSGPAGLKVTVETIDDTIGKWLPWVAAVGDKVNYRVTVTNNGPPVKIESVTDTLPDTDLVCVPEGGCAGALGSGNSYVYQSLAPHEVTSDEYYAQDELVNVVAVQALGRALVVVTSEMNIGHYDDCPDFDGGHFDPADYPTYPFCRWSPPEPGLWSIKFTPDGSGPLTVSMTLRDHVPGNWCVTPDGEGGHVQVNKWRSGEVELLVYLPDGYLPLDHPYAGVCLEGGAGGELFGDGNAGHYYFFSNVAGTIQAEQVP